MSGLHDPRSCIATCAENARICREALFEIDGGLRICGGSWKLRRCQFLELSR